MELPDDLEESALVRQTREALEAWPYRLGMSFYKAGISAFFAGGGLSWLKKKYKVGLEERMGLFGTDVPKNALWVHAVSVGEVQSALSLIGEAKKRSNLKSLPCVLSTVTATGRAMGEKLTPEAKMIYNPWDTPRFVKRALDTLAPRAYVAMETERWPVMLAELHARGIPAFLANGRLSPESAKKLRRQRTFWRGVLCCFDRLMVRFESDKEEFSSLGVPEEKIVVTGDCKIDAMLARKAEMDAGKNEGKNQQENDRLRRRLRNGDAPLFLAGSTHPGEDEVVLTAFAKVRGACPGARLIIVPRHPQRALYVVAEALPYGKVDLFTNLRPDWDIAVVDKIGVLFELYAAAAAAFVGGSLVPKGGQNLMEPALFGIQAAHGPDMSNFPDAGRMDALGAARTVRSAAQLAEAWLSALEPDAKTRAKQACESYFSSVGGAASRSWDVVTEYAGLGEI
ncbi:MAG: 3-deoxy-D-manno-octulosonic acid transferase [Synergistaceae bacterium]|jgi:3-deoxy-D-manno-octulosonic-acid transferase|nr:3-deoxy-D-manno-octulosonic acid transferase [Synergistaceae bacterium]